MAAGSYRTLLIAIARNEGLYILEWVAYHLALGFDNILIYSNDNTDGSDALLDALAQGGFVTHVDNSGREDIPELAGNVSVQHRAYWKAAHHPLFAQHDWCSFLDLDEFLVLKKHRVLSDFLVDYPDNGAVAINWRTFGSSGLEAYGPEPVIERFTRCSEPSYAMNGLVKCVFRPSRIVLKAGSIGPHYIVLRPDGGLYTYADGERFANYRDESKIQTDIVQLNHYSVKSRAEYAWKQERGCSASAPGRPEAQRTYTGQYFLNHDRNDTRDDSIGYFVPRARRQLTLLRGDPRLRDIEADIRKRAFGAP